MLFRSEFELYRSCPERAVCPAGERLTDAQERILTALRLISNRHPGETVVAVTHAVMIRLAVARLVGISGEDWRIPVGRGSVTLFHANGDDLQLQALPAGADVD